MNKHLINSDYGFSKLKINFFQYTATSSCGSRQNSYDFVHEDKKIITNSHAQKLCHKKAVSHWF